MPPKGKKTKAEEALAFLDDLDNLDAAPPPTTSASTISADSPNPAIPSVITAKASSSTPRASVDSLRPKGTVGGGIGESTEMEKTMSSGPGAAGLTGSDAAGDDEAASALAFLEAQLNQKRAPLSVGTSTPRSSTPLPTSTSLSNLNLNNQQEDNDRNIPTSPPKTASGWGVSSFWSTASSAISAAQKVADEGYKRVRTEGVGGLEQFAGGVSGIDVARLRKEAEERLGGYVKGVDLEKLSMSSLSFFVRLVYSRMLRSFFRISET